MQSKYVKKTFFKTFFMKQSTTLWMISQKTNQKAKKVLSTKVASDWKSDLVNIVEVGRLAPNQLQTVAMVDKQSLANF